MKTPRLYTGTLRQALVVGTLAGLTGGAAEIGWVALYGALTGQSAPAVARGVTEAVAPAWALTSQAAGLGVLIHLLLAVLLGTSLVLALRLISRRRRGQAPAEFAWTAAALAGIWAVNFFLLLPWISPGFVQLLPYAVTMVSKLLFGVSAAAILRARRAEWVAGPER